MTDHGHAHHHDVEQLGDGRLVAGIAVNTLLTAAQIVGGVMSGSLALVADALHNLNDAAALGLALYARRVARRPADAVRTFGYRRAEVIGALVNTVTLLIVGVYLVVEAVTRFLDPEPIDGRVVIVVAAIALIVDVATALLMRALAKGSLNARAAFVHNVADALGALAVLVVGVLIVTLGWTWTDLAATLLIAGYILVQCVPLLRASVRILMDSVPPHLELAEVAAAMQGIRGVDNVHHLHVRQMDEHRAALEAHVTLVDPDAGDGDRIKRDLRKLLADRFGVRHATLELETPGACPDPDDHCS